MLQVTGEWKVQTEALAILLDLGKKVKPEA